MIELYKKYNVDKDYTSIGLFRAIKERFNSKKVLYPGCYVHITPSLIFSDITYVDSFKDTYKFYESKDVKEYIEKNKKYGEKTKIKFYHQDYSKDIPEKLKSFDLIISQYGGFVGQAVKKYLNIGGILLCNDSHGDATMASIDSDYKLIGVYNRISDEEFTHSEKNLDEYLIPKKEKNISKEEIKKTMKGIKYTKNPSGYIFKKIN